MSVTKIGDFAPGDVNLNNVMTWTNYNAIANDKISFKFDSGPKIAAGSIFESAGAIFEVLSDTIISGSANTPNYVYFDSTLLSFSFATTVPTWDNAKQGYYSSGKKAILKGFGNDDFQYLAPPTAKEIEKIYSASSLVVEDGGKIDIDQNGQIRINENGDLNVESNGQINAKNGSEINILSGAELSCANAFSATDGRLEMLSNSNFRLPLYAYGARPSSPEIGDIFAELNFGGNALYRVYIYGGPGQGWNVIQFGV